MRTFYPGRCHMCDEHGDVANVEIYWIGSEGLDACQPCLLKVTEFVREFVRERNERKKQAFLQNKQKPTYEKQGDTL